MAAELKAKLSLNDSLFSAGLRRSKNEAIRFGKDVGGHLAGFITQPLMGIGSTVAAALSFNAFKNGVTGAFLLGDELFKLNRKTGIGVGSLNALKEAATESGVEFESVAGSITKMQRTLVDAEKHGAGGKASILRLLKLNVSELSGLRPEQQFQKIGVAINSINDPAQRANAAIQIFGRSGAQMLPIFAEIGNANFANLSEKSKTLQQSAADFHRATIEIAKAKENLDGIYVGIAAGMLPVLKGLTGHLKNEDMTSVGKSWGVSLGKGLAEFWTGAYWQRLVGQGKGKLGDLFQGMGLAGLAEIYHKDAASYEAHANKLRGDAGVPVGSEGGAAEADAVTVAGYLSPLEGKTGLQSGSLASLLGADQWKALFTPRMRKGGSNFEAFGGALSRGAFGQVGGLGSLAGMDPKTFSAMADIDQVRALLTPQEWQGYQNQMVAAGGVREGSNLNAYNSVAAGDDQRRAAYLKEQLKQKIGVDKSNELLEDIKSAVEETADVWKD